MDIARRVIEMLRFYNLFLIVFAPFLGIKKALKFRARGHAHEWDKARWNAPRKLPKDERISIILVALAWGEVPMLVALSAELERRNSRLRVIWALRDENARRQAQELQPEREIVPMPFDFVVPVARWLDATAPDVVVVMEKFWWPNLIWGAKNRGAKLILVNGRSRGRERARYKLMGAFQKWILGAFDLLLFESAAQIARLQGVLPSRTPVVATGNLKFSLPSISAPPQAAQLENWVMQNAGNRPILGAGSTGDADENWILEAWPSIEASGAVLLLAPRNTKRADEIEKRFQNAGFRVARRSELGRQVELPDLLLLDTLGELAFCYQWARAAYVGGAVTGRGHNILEPLAWGVPVAYGPQRGDFESAQTLAEESGVGFRLRSARELAAFWASWQETPSLAAFETQTRALFETQNGALHRVVAPILALVDKDFPPVAPGAAGANHDNSHH